ncbi:T9SS type A sorting domain-containing protein [Paracrocinitomix mangrovi]|uniref:T9SS type A sorting domain-containing protein n=1 Tax=Paracrocinitomix mangrovi TaxID=2862509 RepID=UPI001C8D7141|nr:T9SS type A sorting domain-containing protein [Paracrocinitomix mangrovi]UKN02431.1 T9SS type A sorting domain-containing protein [Paracrocinitomix mangrovi]
MKTTFLILGLLICSITSFGQTTLETIQVNGVTRQYYKYVPVNYDPITEEVPLIIFLHGLGGTASQLTAMGMHPIADTARFIIIYPQGLANGQGSNAWNNNTLLSSSGEDVLLMSRLIDTLNNDHNIDLSRVYMSGISMGSIMTYTTLNVLSDRIAAAVCHIGTMSTIDLGNYTPDYPTPILHIHGTNDGTVPYYPPALPSLSVVQPTIDKLKDINGFQGDSTVTQLADNASDGITIDKIVYNCTTPLELWRMNNADHIILFEPTNDTNTTELTWLFFQQFTHPNPSAANITSFTGTEAMVYPNPANNEVYITNYTDFQKLEIYTIDGRLIKSENLEQNTVDCSSLNQGNYLFHFTDLQNNISVKRMVIE